MPIRHVFWNIPEGQWPNGLYTQDGILRLPDDVGPEVLILGTFNPEIEGNHADFFHGRDYLWPALWDMLGRYESDRSGPRIGTNQKKWPPSKPLIPSLDEIAEIVVQMKIAFADLVGCLFPHDLNYEVRSKNEVLWNGGSYDLIKDADLDKLAGLWQVQWNTRTIVEFIRANDSIEHVYFTREFNGRWADQLEEIRQELTRKGKKLTQIYSPAAGKKTVGSKRRTVIGNWLRGDREKGLGALDSDWLQRNGIDPTDRRFYP
ncbi:MAG: hypothetical protein KDC03_23915 [Flavobacteriales bacterium]|nr:hypothetical protein [Flavobacteriales bacterium]MCB0787435.1 hypothetical protein [Flavobacteriales bacterium]